MSAKRRNLTGVMFAGVVLLVVTTEVACTQRQVAGDFTYSCRRGGGMLDGWSCDASLTRGFLLWISEDGEGPTIHYMPSRDRQRPHLNHLGGHAREIPTAGDATITAVGFDNRVLLAEASDGAWYLVDLLEERHWPRAQGPFTRQEIEARFSAFELPAMRASR